MDAEVSAYFPVLFVLAFFAGQLTEKLIVARLRKRKSSPCDVCGWHYPRSCAWYVMAKPEDPLWRVCGQFCAEKVGWKPGAPRSAIAVEKAIFPSIDPDQFVSDMQRVLEEAATNKPQGP